jgi:hypothetical protein
VGSIVLLYGSDWTEVAWCAAGMALGALVANARFLARFLRGLLAPKESPG